MEALSGRPLYLADLLAMSKGSQLSDSKLEAEQLLQFLHKMRELARGLVSSEYWELIGVVLVEGLEVAKASLENETITIDKFRLSQGEARAYRSAYNLFLELAKEDEKEKDDE